MAGSLPKDSSPHLQNSYDAIALLTHACMLAVGFRLVGLGEDHKLQAPSSSSDIRTLPKEWNVSSSSDYAFRYTHSQSSLEYLVKITRLGSKAVINGLGIGDEKVHTLDLPVKDYVSQSSFPYSAPKEGGENENALTLRQLFISEGRLTDAGSLLKVQIIQKLAPGLQKEGYEDSAHAASQYTQPRQRGDRRTSDPENPREDRRGHDPLRDDRPAPHAQPRPFNDPLAAEPRRPFPAGDFPPPEFEDEYDITRPLGRGGIGGERRPLNIGERDLYPPGLGPHDPFRGAGLRPGEGGGMYPTFEDFLGGERAGRGEIDPRAPPGARYIIDVVEAPYTFEQLRTGHILRPFIRHLSHKCHHPDIVSALMILKWHFSSAEQDDRGVHESRGYACELIAWKYLSCVTESEHIDLLLHEVPPSTRDQSTTAEADSDGVMAQGYGEGEIDAENAMLLPKHVKIPHCPRSVSTSVTPSDEDSTAAFVGLNALEIAAISNASKFLSQDVVQSVINDIWHGRIVFWDSLYVHSKKEAKVYNKGLRVPKYQKAFEAVFFVLFLVLYYIVLSERNPNSITTAEIFLFVWIAAFAYEEFGELKDTGALFYTTDFWSLWNIAIVGVGIAFLIARVIGLSKHSDKITHMSFDILSIEALFLVPRVCSLLTLNSYFGTLIPCLKEMAKDFARFLSIVAILFLGFLTAFTMLARGAYGAREVLWIMIQVFFGQGIHTAIPHTTG
ncbi:MAG: hypothetical protein Q9163_002761 [Psora crenata]